MASDKSYLIELKKDEVLCLAGEQEYDLFILHEGKLMVCLNRKSEITPLAYLEEGEYLGELSFFDHQPRSAHVIAMEDSTLVRIPVEEIDRQMPDWLITMAKSLARRLRAVDEVISSKGLKRKKVKSIEPLSIAEQTHYFKILNQAYEEKGLGSLKDRNK